MFYYLAMSSLQWNPPSFMKFQRSFADKFEESYVVEVTEQNTVEVPKQNVEVGA